MKRRTPVPMTVGFLLLAPIACGVMKRTALVTMTAGFLLLATAACGEAETDRSAELYDPDTVQTFELEIAAADVDAMVAALPERIYVSATFRWNDVTLTDVGVRFKGNSSSSPDQPYKRSYLIKFNEFVDGQYFLGLRRLSIDNAIQFGGLYSERLITDILRELGVTIMRTNYCRLIINGEHRGVYVNVERIDKSFLERYYGDADGPLFKVDEGGPGEDMTYLGDDPALYATAFEPKNTAAEESGALLVDFIRDVNETPETAFMAMLEERFEVDEFVPLMAVMLFSGAFDQYTGWGAHNYYLYRDPSTSRWTYLAWDLDVGFADNAFEAVPVLDGWNAAYPYPKAERPLLAGMLADPALLARYRNEAAIILEDYFHPDLLISKLNALHDQIRDDLADDPFPPGRVTVPSDTDHDSVVASIEEFIRLRYDRAVAELADPVVTTPEPAPGAGPDGIPPPGPPSTDAPGDLTVVATTSAYIELSWTDNTSDEIAFIVQRCEGTGCTDFQNHIGVPDPDTVSIIDSGVVAGATYRYRVYAIHPVGLEAGGTGPSNIVEATAAD